MLLRFVRLLDSPATLRRAAFASIVANVGIVVTGGLVRLTNSGLGCPTWPTCTDDSYVTTPAMGLHGVIEFGNRTLASVVSAIAAFGVVVAFRQRHRLPGALRTAVAVLGGVAAQAVLGGVTVHLRLNPWIVAAHFLLSMVLIAAAHAFWTRTRDEPPRWAAPGATRTLGVVVTAVSAAVLVLGTLVTGSGPHSGDTTASRTGFDPQAISQLHADVVLLLLGLSLATWLAVRALKAPPQVTRAVRLLVLVEVAQGVVGFVQYFTGLPWLVVILHMLGACLVWLATLNVLTALSARAEGPLPAAQRDHSLASTA